MAGPTLVGVGGAVALTRLARDGSEGVGGVGVGGENCFFGYLWRYFLYVKKNKKKSLHISESVCTFGTDSNNNNNKQGKHHESNKT